MKSRINKTSRQYKQVIYRNYKKLLIQINSQSNRHSKLSLKDLYIRDKGICYLCGKRCDYKDYTGEGKTFKPGDYYPSIDHVVPLTKGGKDNWNNIRLAHRICNCRKGNSDDREKY